MKFFYLLSCLILLVGCSQRGDLKPYLLWKPGTVVIVHLSNKNSGDQIWAKGKLVRVTADEIRISTDSNSESVGYPKELIEWVEKAGPDGEAKDK